ncbi:hypothetical protein AGOR_G00052270 [Albula goreensis]|uniref:THD domain-containing protein n=1 Tax=Albula goreensis TaxID=1534307 RepID=A0A8T3DZ57_9TELE|nr:hypothetical protein AGOR_G00052270 [Albula goreensis]
MCRNCALGAMTLCCERQDMSKVQIEPDRSVLILIEHCNEMKRQERYSRTITGFLFLGFTALFFFYTHSRISSECKHSIKDSEYGTGAYQRQIGTRPNAHLTAPETSIHNVTTLEWESKNGDAFLQDFDYGNNALIVPKDGRYSVYLQLTYRMTEKFVCIPGNLIQLTQEVYRLSDSYPVETLLMVASDTVNCSEKKWRRSIYTSGVFQLEKGDRLFVKAGNAVLIDYNEKRMFFGAFLV